MTTKTEIYERVTQELEALVGSQKDMPWETGLVSLIAILKEKFATISWVGFYRESPSGSGTLWVGPYQGKVACVVIPPGKGVCGAAFKRQETLIVPDVDRFPGHIACDSLSRSEIVLPIVRDGKPLGVLDLDSHQLAAFDAIDADFLAKFLRFIDEGCSR